MANPKVLILYMTIADFLRSGHRMEVADIEIDTDGIIGDKDHDKGKDLLLLSKTTYDIIEEADLVIDRGLLMENICVDADINDLKEGTIIEIGEVMFEVKGNCEAYGYLYKLAPELPDLIRGKRGIFISPVEYGQIKIGDELIIVQEPEALT